MHFKQYEPYCMAQWQLWSASARYAARSYTGCLGCSFDIVAALAKALVSTTVQETW